MNEKIDTYHALLLKWQNTVNLVSRHTVDDAKHRHFDDSSQLLSYIPETAKVICDIGSGAGFPGLVIAIERPDIHVHLIESDTRKCAFLREVSRETKCENVTIHNDRVENVINNVEADLVTARALASLRQLISYVRPLWGDNNQLKMILPKGKTYKDEIIDAEKKFTFDCDVHDSKTDHEAKILIVGNMLEK